MGVERYLRPQHSLDINEEMSKRKKEDGNKYAKSEYHRLAWDFAFQGREGLKDLGEIMPRENTSPLTPESAEFRSLTPQEQSKFIENYSAIWFGVTMRAIEGMLSEQYFNTREFCAWYTNMILGTRVPRLKEPTKHVQLEQKAWNRLIQLHKLDNKYTIFFSDGYAALPDSLTEILRKNDAPLSFIRHTIIPAYLKRTEELTK